MFPIGVVKFSTVLTGFGIKDHYQTLGISSKATLEEIKKSFRKLAHEYHPDKNTTNVFAEARFREIHEAYSVLAHPGRRAVYDQDRWLSGRFKKDAAAWTPALLLQELEKLHAHLGTIDVYRMNRQLLKDYLLFMLSDERAALLVQQATATQTAGIAGQLLKAAEYLPFYFSLPVLKRLHYILAGNTELQQVTGSKIKRLEREARLHKYYPWLILLVTLLILFAMYFFSLPRK